MKFGEIRKPLMTACLITSVALHFGVIWFIYSHPPHIKQGDALAIIKPAPSLQIAPKDEKEKLVEKMEQALEQAMNTVITTPQHTDSSTDIANDDSSQNDSEIDTPDSTFSSQPNFRKEELHPIHTLEKEFATSMPAPFDPELGEALIDFALGDTFDDETLTYASEEVANIDFSAPPALENFPDAAQAVEDDYTLTDAQFSPSALPTHLAEGLAPQFVASLKTLQTPAAETDGIHRDRIFTELQESSSPKLILPNAVDYLRSQWLKRSLAQRGKLPDFSYYGLDELATNLEWERDLDVEMSVMADPNSNKYIFSLTIHPEFETTCESMKQNFYFVIDRSNTIEKHKLSRFKRAVQRSLAALHEGDTFNIYFFDKKVVKLSQKALAVTPRTIQKAEGFLEQQGARASSKETESYTSLEDMLPSNFDPTQLHSVILISDGNSLLGDQHKRKAISSLPKTLNSNVNIYAAAAGKGNNLVLLDLLSYSTAGKLLYSDTNAGFPRKLVRLVRDLHHPIVKNLRVDLSAASSTAEVTIYPRTQILPPMFANQAYTLTGTVDEICNLDLVIQGQNHNRWVNVHKKLSLKDATRSSRSLEKAWADTQAKLCYEHFIKNGKNYHLKEAKQIVAPYRGVIASDQ